MLPAPARAASLAGLLALTGVAVASPAHAAPAKASDTTTITVDSKPVDLFEGLKVSGTCPTGSDSAVVTVVQFDAEIAHRVVNVGDDGAWAATVNLLEEEQVDLGPATASVSCLDYTGERPLGQAETDFSVDLPDFPFDEIEVGVRPQRVAIGGSITISATCPEGSTVATVLAGNPEAREPFHMSDVVPGRNGRISQKVRIVADGDVRPEPGRGVVLVLCGDDSQPMPGVLGARKGAARLLAAEAPLTARALEDMVPTAVGFAEFTILPAVVQPHLPTGPTKVVTTPARSAVPVADPAPATPDRLAMTGSDPAPLAAIGVTLLALGGALIRRARRA